MREFLKDPDRKAGLILLALCMILWFFVIPSEVAGRAQSLLPRVYAALVALLSVVLIVRSYSREPMVKQNVSNTQIQNDTEVRTHRIIRIIVVAVILVIYILSINLIGYFISSALTLFLLMFYLRLRSWKLLVLVPAVVLLAIYLFFEIGCKMRFPRGSIF